MPHDHISVRDDDGVRIVTLDDGKANVLPLERTQALIEVFEEAESDADVRAIVLAGRPGRFSAGFDLSVMADGDLTGIRAMVDGGGALVRTMYGGSVPIVAACTGHAIAAGALLLLASDVRVGPDLDIKIGLNEVAIGMVLPGWGFVLAGERLSRRHHAQAVCTSQFYDGAGAVAAGYLDYVTTPEHVLDLAITQARRLGGLDRDAYIGTIARVRSDALSRIDADLG